MNLIVPTGNLGNALAAVWARELGAPLGDIVLATNANRTLLEFFESGLYRGRPSVATLANAMDVGDPSNFERLVWTFPDLTTLRSNLKVWSGRVFPRSPGPSRWASAGTGRCSVPTPLPGSTSCGGSGPRERRAPGRSWRRHIQRSSRASSSRWWGIQCRCRPPLAELLSRPSHAEPLAADAAALRRRLLDHGAG